ncbi:MAG: GHKL domain-containing protein [Bacteriovorax sp.]
MMSWFKKKESVHSHFEADKRERLFFHDIINLTHGLILFLNQRQSSHKGIDGDEILMLEKEIRTLQCLIKDHFHFKHKNLANTYDWIPFSVAEIAVTGLIQTYLPEQFVKTFVHLEGKISYDRSLQERESALLYYPAFYRIMNNLIKNMAEAKSTEVHFHFNYFENGFLIETRNKIASSDDQRKMADYLSRTILEKNDEDESESDNTGVGLGLLSVHSLAVENGGRFDFEIVNNFWINRITLPVPQAKKEFKKVA